MRYTEENGGGKKKEKENLTPVLLRCAAVLFLAALFTTGCRKNAADTSLLQSDEEKGRNPGEEAAQEHTSSEGESADAACFYQKLTEGKDVRILIIGDSIGEGEGTSDEGTPWFEQLRLQLSNTYGSSVDITNVSMGGNTAYAGYVRTLALDYEEENPRGYDLAILCFAHNDKDRDFALYYEALIRAVRRKYPDASMISILESSLREYTQRIKTVQSLSAYYGIQTADTIASFNDSDMDYDDLVTKDGVHPNDKGQEIYCRTVKSVIDENAGNMTGKMQDVPPWDPDVHRFDNFTWYGKNTWKREDGVDFSSAWRITGWTVGAGKSEEESLPDLAAFGSASVFALSCSGAGLPGIDYTFLPGENYALILVDGKLYSASEVTFDFDFSQRYIRITGEDTVIEDGLKVVFENSNEADGFYGMCLSFGEESRGEE